MASKLTSPLDLEAATVQSSSPDVKQFSKRENLLQVLSLLVESIIFLSSFCYTLYFLNILAYNVLCDDEWLLREKYNPEKIVRYLHVPLMCLGIVQVFVRVDSIRSHRLLLISWLTAFAGFVTALTCILLHWNLYSNDDVMKWFYGMWIIVAATFAGVNYWFMSEKKKRAKKTDAAAVYSLPEGEQSIVVIS